MKRNNFLNLAKAKEEALAKAAADKLAREKNTLRKKFFVNNIGTNIDFDFNDSTNTDFDFNDSTNTNFMNNKYYITNNTATATTTTTTANNINLSGWDIE
jgi:hypothetical protein